MFHSGHIQNIVDQIQQLTAGKINPVDISPHFFGIFTVLAHQLGESQNCVERGTHIVGHIIKESMFGFFASAGVFQCVFQQFAFFELLLFFLIHFFKAEDDLFWGQRFVKQNADVYPAVFVAKPAEKIAAIVPDTARNQIAHTFGRKTLLKFCESIRRDYLSNYIDQLGIRPLRWDSLSDII